MCRMKPVCFFEAVVSVSYDGSNPGAPSSLLPLPEFLFLTFVQWMCCVPQLPGTRHVPKGLGRRVEGERSR